MEIVPARRAIRPALLLALAVLALAPAAFAEKRSEIPGYVFSQLTDNDVTDWFPRVSPDGLITWVGRYQLPGAQSQSGTDAEVFLWDGVSIAQVTDDDIDQDRPVVNDRGDLAWQDRLGDGRSDITARIATRTVPLTDDSPSVDNRYPDINARGVVVWGRRNAEGATWHLAVYDPETPSSFRVLEERYAYRPRVNSRDHVVFATSYQFAESFDVYDLSLTPIGGVPGPSGGGYSRYQRPDLNDDDQVALEADPGLWPHPDFLGPRHILFWDGDQIHLVHASSLWAGRPGLNARGVIVWEGRGCLEACRSSGEDTEIFVHDFHLGQTIQITDDDVEDAWPAVTANGTIVWFGRGGYPDGSSDEDDFEIFLAVPHPDGDRDGVRDLDDNCPGVPNLHQSDGDTDGVGDACDNCRHVENTDQTDTDQDGIGNFCDGDFDQSGYCNVLDLLMFLDAFGNNIGDSVCPDEAGNLAGSCARYDLTGEGALINTGDLLVLIDPGVFGTRTSDHGCAPADDGLVHCHEVPNEE